MYYYNIDQGDVIVRNGKELIILGYNWFNIELKLLSRYQNTDYSMFMAFLSGTTIDETVQNLLGNELFYLEENEDGTQKLCRGHSHYLCDTLKKDVYKKEEIKRKLLKLSLLGKYNGNIDSIKSFKEIIEEISKYKEENFPTAKYKRVIDIEKRKYKKYMSGRREELVENIVNKRNISIFIRTYEKGMYYYYNILLDNKIVYLGNEKKSNFQENFKIYNKLKYRLLHMFKREYVDKSKIIGKKCIILC